MDGGSEAASWNAEAAAGTALVAWEDLKLAETCESQAGMVEGLQKDENGSQAWVDGSRSGTGKRAGRMRL